MEGKNEIEEMQEESWGGERESKLGVERTGRGIGEKKNRKKWSRMCMERLGWGVKKEKKRIVR